MPCRSLEHCSLQYLNRWISQDSQICHALKFGNPKEKLTAINHAVSFYRISRNLPLSGDTGKGLPRCKPLLDVIEKVNRDDFKSDPVSGIRNFESAIQKHYGPRGMASLATKLLWLKLKRPIIIYDSQARAAIGTRSGDLNGFYQQWRIEFNSHASEIARVCRNLETMGPYSVDAKKATPKFIHKVASTKWFHERVFDMYLWMMGAD
jgi:hypothetical protein